MSFGPVIGETKVAAYKVQHINLKKQSRAEELMSHVLGTICICMYPGVVFLLGLFHLVI